MTESEIMDSQSASSISSDTLAKKENSRFVPAKQSNRSKSLVSEPMVIIEGSNSETMQHNSDLRRSSLRAYTTATTTNAETIKCSKNPPLSVGNEIQDNARNFDTSRSIKTVRGTTSGLDNFTLFSKQVDQKPGTSLTNRDSLAHKGDKRQQGESSESGSSFGLRADKMSNDASTSSSRVLYHSKGASSRRFSNKMVSRTSLAKEPGTEDELDRQQQAVLSAPIQASTSKSTVIIINNCEEDKISKTKTKRRRGAQSLGSSLRHLLAVTFNRNCSPTVAQPSRESKIKTTDAHDSKEEPRGETMVAAQASSSEVQENKADPTSKNDSDKSSTHNNKNKRRQFMTVIRSIPNPKPSAELSQSQENSTISHAKRGSTSSPGHRVMPDESSFPGYSKYSRNSFDDGQKKKQESNRSTQQSSTAPTSQDTLDEEDKTECPLCVQPVKESSTPHLGSCRHRVCLECMQRYITTEINHSRLNITCPVCSEPLHPNTIKDILQNEKLYLKYETFLLRRVLAAEPDARWCPAPDCCYVVLANGCASCPKLVCGRSECNTSFCYHCKQEWHPNQTCLSASIQRNKRMFNAYVIGNLIEESGAGQPSNSHDSKSGQQSSIRPDTIKECPVCASRIIKMNDGSCNHMTCSICETEFCWLCMKEISDLHYFSPSGCTFWGRKPWSRKKKLLWQLGMLVGAPICIILIAGIAVPAIVIGIPVWAARKIHTRLEGRPLSKYKKNAIITGGVLLSFLVSPIISALALAIGIPILLGYVYGVVPLSLCRSSGGCLSSAPSLEVLQNNLRTTRTLQANDLISIDTAISHKAGDPSIGETSMYMSNISLETNSIGHVTTVEREDRESASNAALAGSIISNTAEDGNSTRALAGSILSKESGNTVVPAEVHI